jgi:hypothetical protein
MEKSKQEASKYAAHLDGGTSLHFASWFGQTEMVQTLLEHGADAVLRDKVRAAGTRSCRGHRRGGVSAMKEQ